MIHILPIDDKEEYEMSTECKCAPVALIDGTTIIKHNSFDGRELVEVLIEETGVSITHKGWKVVSAG